MGEGIGENTQDQQNPTSNLEEGKYGKQTIDTLIKERMEGGIKVPTGIIERSVQFLKDLTAEAHPWS